MAMIVVLAAGQSALCQDTRPKATTNPVEPPDPNVPPESFKVSDLPSDDGSAMLVQWAKPPDEPDGRSYIVEIAMSPEALIAGEKAKSIEDVKAGKIITKPVKPSAKTLASAKPKFFGYGKKYDKIYFAAVSPADCFKALDPPKITPERLSKLVSDGLITEEICKRANAFFEALKNEKIAEAAAALLKVEVSSSSKVPASEKRWFGHLEAFLNKKAQEAINKDITDFNSATFYYRLVVVDEDSKTYLARDGQPIVLTGQAQSNLFKWYKMNNLVLSILFCGIVYCFIELAKRKGDLFIRKIAGLEAVDEAIGRSTEMDRPVFFVHGLGAMGDLSTIASIGVLSRVARRTADHDSRVRVMNYNPIVTVVSQEVVQQAYTEAGRPDAYNADDCSLVAADQFSYAAAVSGIMVREKPGAIFHMGPFAAESLLLAEAGASTGAIQIAGTDSTTQIPFFITTCDYTLIGEELYAASAYLSREPKLLGSLRGQDVGKAFLMIAIVIGSIALTIAAYYDTPLSWLRSLLEAN